MCFLKWWSQHGPIAEILPNELKDKMLYFAFVYKVSEYNNNFPVFLLFFAKYHVPWIVKWYYKIEENVLVRHFAIKWYGKFSVTRIIGFVDSEFPLTKTKKLEEKPSSSKISVESILVGKSIKDLAEIVQMAA